VTDQKISALSDGSPLVGTDAFVIARAGANYKILASALPSGGSSTTVLGQPVAVTILTSETTASASYVDLATVGPSVTVTVGADGILLVGWGCHTSPAAGENGWMSLALSGANTLAASDDYTWGGGVLLIGGTTRCFTGLTPGATTITAKYRSDGSHSHTFLRRHLWACGDVSVGGGGRAELDYAEWTGGDITLSGTTQTLVTGNAITCDGSALMIECFIPKLSGSSPNVSFYATIDGTRLGYLGQAQLGSVIAPFYGAYRYTPSAGSHTFGFASQLNGGSGTVHGARATTDYGPIYIRVLKA
jgi:hypothetical protein